jgi:hypothetical protein
MRGQLWLAAALLLCACDDFHYYSGRFYHETRRGLKAVDPLEAFVQARPDDPRAAEARVRLGEIHASGFRRCLEARREFEAALRSGRLDAAWDKRAKAGLMACPDYFPLEEGRSWVYGDSASRGRNMRLELQVERSSASAQGQVTSSLFAGKKRIRSATESYRKEDWTLWRLEGPKKLAVLKYPYLPGMSWAASDGMRYKIESNSEKVRTQAGTFELCLKVRESNPQIPDSWKYDYYAPGVGRVKTSVAGPGYENPNTELLSFTR